MSLPLPKPDLEGVDYELWGQNAQADCWFEAKVRAYAAAAVEAEREQCALACEQRRDYEMQYARGSAAIAASDCADAIRARSKA